MSGVYYTWNIFINYYYNVDINPYGVSELRTKTVKTCELRTKSKKVTYELRTQI